jgi:aryl-alcohol dehydrogenase-like predicted oxidoreductase
MLKKAPPDAMTRLALGTAQFGLNYGVANCSGQVGQTEIADILALAAAAGIDTLDTAIAYGQSETQLGRAGLAGWRVITKIPPLPAGVAAVHEWIVGQVTDSLGRLRIGQLEAILLHRSSDLLGPRGEVYLQSLIALKEKGLTRALGVSIYDPSELDDMWAMWSPDLVQAPFNVLDRRLLHSGWLDRLVREGVRVHLRSAFLQGLLLIPRDRRPGGFAPWSSILDRWLQWCATNDVSPLRGALTFARSLGGAEFVVVGVDSASHLGEVLSLCSDDQPVPPEDLFSGDRDLIDPSRWKIA